MTSSTDTTRSAAPTRHVLLYDGRCRFCRAQASRLIRLAATNAIELRSFHDDGALDEFPGMTREICMQAMQLVSPDRRIYSGMEAAARALATRRIIGLPAYIYYVPGIRQLADALYRWIAANRYRFGGSTTDACESGSCPTHHHH